MPRQIVHPRLWFSLLLGGCQSQALLSSVKLEGMSSEAINVPPPIVSVEAGEMSIQGVVRRSDPTNPDPNYSYSGRVEIKILSPAGAELMKLPAYIRPEPIPVDGNAESGYFSAPIGWLPPPGSTIRVRFVDRGIESLQKLNGQKH